MDNSILASDKEARAILESLHRAERSMIIWAIRIFGLILDLYTTFSNRNIRVDEMMIAAAFNPKIRLRQETSPMMYGLPVFGFRLCRGEHTTTGKRMLAGDNLPF